MHLQNDDDIRVYHLGNEKKKDGMKLYRVASSQFHWKYKLSVTEPVEITK